MDFQAYQDIIYLQLLWQMKDLIVKKDFPPGGQMNASVSFYISKIKNR